MDTSFMSRGRCLRGSLVLPANEKGPVAILLPGLNTDRHFPLLAETGRALSARGIGVLSFDFAGTGSSDGDCTDITIPNQVTDAMNALAHVRARGLTGPVILVGHSQGSAVAILAASRAPNSFASLLLYAPAGAIEDQFKAGHIADVHFPADDIPRIVMVHGNPLSREYFVTGQHLHLYEQAGKYQGPVGIINGDNDALVPLAYACRFHEIYHASRLIVIHGADHAFTGLQEEAVQAACDLLDQLILTNVSD